MACRQWVRDQKKSLIACIPSAMSTPDAGNGSFSGSSRAWACLWTKSPTSSAALPGAVAACSPFGGCTTFCSSFPRLAGNSTRNGIALLLLSERQLPEPVAWAAPLARTRMWRRWRFRQSVPKRFRKRRPGRPCQVGRRGLLDSIRILLCSPCLKFLLNVPRRQSTFGTSLVTCLQWRRSFRRSPSISVLCFSAKSRVHPASARSMKVSSIPWRSRWPCARLSLDHSPMLHLADAEEERGGKSGSLQQFMIAEFGKAVTTGSAPASVYRACEGQILDRLTAAMTECYRGVRRVPRSYNAIWHCSLNLYKKAGEPAAPWNTGCCCKDLFSGYTG